VAINKSFHARKGSTKERTGSLLFGIFVERLTVKMPH